MIVPTTGASGGIGSAGDSGQGRVSSTTAGAFFWPSGNPRFHEVKALREISSLSQNAVID
jgi:hypothetical protein